MTDQFDRVYLLSADNDYVPAIKRTKELYPNKEIIICPPPQKHYAVHNLNRASGEKDFFRIKWKDIKTALRLNKLSALNNGLLIQFNRVTDNTVFTITPYSTANRNVVLPLTYSNTSYIVIGSTSYSGIMFVIFSPDTHKKTTEFTYGLGNISGRTDSQSYNHNVSWLAIGY